MSAMSLSGLLPGLAIGFERRQRLDAAKGRSLRACGSYELPIMWEFLSRRFGADEAVEIMAEGGWRSWATRARELVVS